MALIFITRRIPQEGIFVLTDAGHTVEVQSEDRVLTKSELITALSEKPYDAVLSLLTDTIDGEVMGACPSLKIIANCAVGFDNIDTTAAHERGIYVTNTPDVLTETVALHAMSLIISLARRIPESDRFMRAGKYEGWEPMLFLGMDLKDKMLGIIGAGRIGSALARMARGGFGMRIAYTGPSRNEALEQKEEATYVASVDELLAVADVVSLHVPLTPDTAHLMNADRLQRMKPTAYLVNTSRGGVIDEPALVEALQKNTIAGAALDVYEHEPALTPGLSALENVVLTPHIASASRETRAAMAQTAAKNILAALQGEKPPNSL